MQRQMLGGTQGFFGPLKLQTFKVFAFMDAEMDFALFSSERFLLDLAWVLRLLKIWSFI